MAVGQTTDLSFVDPEWSLKVDRGLILADKETQGTNMPGIFAGGDVTSGPATVIEAIAAGRRAAVAIDLYLNGRAQAEDRDEKTVKPLFKFNTEYLKRTSRAEMPRLPVDERKLDVEDALGLGLSEIETEANRCFNCGCVAVNSSNIAVALLALCAKVKIAGPKGVRTIPVENFFGSLRNVLKADEMVTEIEVPKPSDNAKQVLFKFRLRNAVDFPIVSVASMIRIDDGICKDAKIALGAVAPRPIRAKEAEQAIKGKAIDSSTAEAAAEAAVANSIPLNMNTYKVQITKSLVKRAILLSN